MVKHILASGCSFTEGGRLGLDPYDNPWPVQLSKMLNCKVTNLGICGQGNDYIFESIIKQVCDNPGKYDLVCVMWSEAMRVGSPSTYTPGNYITYNPFNEVSRYSCINELNEMNWDKTYDDGYIGAIQRGVTSQWYFTYGTAHPSDFTLDDSLANIVKRYIDTLMAKVIALEAFLKSLGINCIFSQGTDIVSGQDSMCLQWVEAQQITAEYIIEKSIIDNIDTNLWTNWPPATPLGNQSYIQTMIDNGTVVSLYDAHPNEQGHQIIAEEYLKKYNELYGS